MKISLNTFSGIRPVIPDHNLPENAASLAVNVRLDNSAIRNIFQSQVTAFTPETLTDIPDNMFKASYAPDAISWLVWDLDNSFDTVDILETRFNTLAEYVIPKPPPPVVVGTFNIELLPPAFVSQATPAEYALFKNITYTPNTGALPSIINYSDQITADVGAIPNQPVTYVWVRLSGDASILIDDINIGNPTFTTTLVPAPIPDYQEPDVVVTKTARWEVTGTDTAAGQSTRIITLSYTSTSIWESP